MSIPDRKIIALSILLIFSNSVKSQSLTNRDYIKAVQDADQFFYFSQDYESAAKLYEALYNKYPDNNNLAAKLGISYLNVDGKKKEALKLLEKASLNVVSSDKEYTEYGRKAPLDTWFYLAHSYHLNDSLDKAVRLYSDVKKKLTSAESFRFEYIDNQIKSCYFALNAEKNKVRTGYQLFVPWLSDYPGASNPVLSQNDSVFVFTSRQPEGNHIMCSFKNKVWQKPEDITSRLSGYDRLWTNSITGDGTTLVLYMDDGADGNLYYSRRSGSDWSRIRKFGKTINTKFWEAHGFITSDGKRLFFSSNRDGGYGELDIWVSDLEPDGSWGKAVNLGSTINTPYNENTPFFDQETATLIFSSEGHEGLGGYDVFLSSLKNGTWSESIGLPVPFNTTDDNTFFILNRSDKGYLTSIVDEKTLSRNIYWLIPLDQASEKITAEGNIDLQDGMNIVPGLADISVRSSDSSSSWKKIRLKENGKFEFTAPRGNYKLHIIYSGYKTDTINLSVPDDFAGNSLAVKSSLVPEKVSSGDFLAIRNILFDFDSATLNERAVFELEKSKNILSGLPELRIEVTGYTDSKGMPDYNLKLAGLRADAVIGYLSSHGIEKSRFIRKAAGATDFVAMNTNADGSDNPAGRQFNRRVTLGIINPQTGITIRQESYTPPQLKYPYSRKYSIVLMKSDEKYFPDYFKDFSMNELLFVKPVLKDSLYLYVLGEFSDRSDAESYLAFAKEKGFRESYIVDQYDLAEEPKQLINLSGPPRRSGEPAIYTIQLRASLVPIKLSEFKQIEGIREVKGKDSYYRYVYGEYVGFSKARTALDTIQKSGYKEAFIKEYSLLFNQ